MAKQKPEKCKATTEAKTKSHIITMAKQKSPQCKATATNMPPQKLTKIHNNGKTEARKMQGYSHKHATTTEAHENQI